MFNFKRYFQLKYISIHNLAFSSEKVVLSESGKKYAQIECLIFIYFLLEEVLLWIMCVSLARSDSLKLKHLNDGFVS